MGKSVRKVHEEAATIRARSGWQDEGMDEALEADGSPKPLYRKVLAAIESIGPGRVARDIRERLSTAGVSFGAGEGEPFEVDVVPRIIEAAEWERVSAGLKQRATALDAFVADAYGERRIVSAGVLDERVIEGTALYERMLRGTETPSGHWTHICGFDLIRDGAGELVVLEDNLRTPSGISYLLAARAAVSGALRETGMVIRSLDRAPYLLAEAIRAAAAPGSDRRAAVLTNGPDSVAHYEHAYLAKALGLPLATPDRLRLLGGKLWLQEERGHTPLDVVYRRTDEDLLISPTGEANELTKPLARLVAEGSVAVVNAFGTGVADDKLSQRHVEAMIRFYLGEEPQIASVPTFDLEIASDREQALEQLETLVVKPRSGQGGHGVQVCGQLGADELAELRSAIRGGECGLIAQPKIALSTHPTWDGERLSPRHVDLRAFALRTGDGFDLIPGGLSRFAGKEGSLIVNSSQGGGAKDTWVLA